MDEEERAWLEKLAAAARERAAELRTLDDPQARPLIDDLEQLGARIHKQIGQAGCGS
jgi:hypothetical protein